MQARTEKRDEEVITTWIGGNCVLMNRGMDIPINSEEFTDSPKQANRTINKYSKS